MVFKADLHCHTYCSDGSLSPEEVVKLAQKIGLQGLSITDHDSIEAYPRAIKASKEANIRLGSGVEFSCEHKGISVHILGYDFLLESKEIQNLCQRHRLRRASRNRGILEKLKKKKMIITEDELVRTGKGTIGRPHIAYLMVQKGYVSSIREAFNLYLGDGKECYVPGDRFSVEESIGVIHAAKGKAFLAHPHLFPKDTPLQEMLNLPFDGIECYYARLLPDRWLKVAEKKKWLISGGSDFHGEFKENALGCATVDQESFEKIFQHVL